MNLSPTEQISRTIARYLADEHRYTAYLLTQGAILDIDLDRQESRLAQLRRYYTSRAATEQQRVVIRRILRFEGFPDPALCVLQFPVGRECNLTRPLPRLRAGYESVCTSDFHRQFESSCRTLKTVRLLDYWYSTGLITLRPRR